MIFIQWSNQRPNHHRAGLALRGDVDELFEDREASVGAQLASAMALRAARLKPVAQEILQAESAGRLSCSVESLLGSYIHMHVNRLLPGDSLSQELVLREVLRRKYQSTARRETRLS